MKIHTASIFNSVKQGVIQYEEPGWYLWRTARTAPGNGDWLCISAHGDERPENPVDGASYGFPDQWSPRFYFKSRKGHVVMAENIAKFVEQAKSVGPRDYTSGWEIIADTTPFESGLTKFQGRHGNNFEDYASIQQDMLTSRTDNPYDVLTVRNRKKGARKGRDALLSEILEWLFDNNLRYGNIVCSFCRHDPYWRDAFTGEAFRG
jgi:hypothetical protein